MHGLLQDKSKQKAKEKVIDDKTFGLKNKSKSAKVQKYVQQLQKSAQPVRNPRLEEPTRKVRTQPRGGRGGPWHHALLGLRCQARRAALLRLVVASRR